MNHFSILYPEINISGFSRDNISVCFYNYVNSLVNGSSVVIDLGAGRGAQFEKTKSEYIKDLQTLKGKVSRLIGVDIDKSVLNNPYLDEAILFHPYGPLPLDDSSADLIYADWVLEHIENPEHFSSEIYRILKPGGWFCARTPNKWGMIGIAETLVPNSLHLRVLRKLQPDRAEEDVFATYQRMNSLWQIRSNFPTSKWNNYSFNYGYEVGYFSRSYLLSFLSWFYNKITPRQLGLVMLVFLQKK